MESDTSDLFSPNFNRPNSSHSSRSDSNNSHSNNSTMRTSGQESLRKSQEMPKIPEPRPRGTPHSSTSSISNQTLSAANSEVPLLTTPRSEVGVGADGDGKEKDGAKEGDWVVLEVSVSDTGIGIDPAIVSKLFRPYAQAAVSTMREYGGSGLGLAITNQIVQLMGGSMYVETEIGKGSKFTFTVPLLIVHEPSNACEVTPPPEIISPLSPSIRHPSPPSESSPILNIETAEFSPQDDEEESATNDHPTLHILVVDDSSINRSILISMLNRVLKKGTNEIDIATNGLEAVELCKKKPYDIVFMDIVMPVMNGWEACRRIREDGFLKYIIITTANQVTGEAAAEIAATGATDAISKPFSKEHIRVILQKFGADYALKT